MDDKEKDTSPREDEVPAMETDTPAQQAIPLPAATPAQTTSSPAPAPIPEQEAPVLDTVASAQESVGSPEPAPIPESLIPAREEPTESAQSNFSELPGGNWSRPVEPTPPPNNIPPTTYTAPPRKPFFADFSSSRLVAFMLCLCLLVSGISGFAGVLIGRSVTLAAGGGTTPSTTVLWETAPSTALPAGTSDGDALTAAVEGVFSTVVEISTETVVSGSFFGQSVQSGAGSGVIISNDGYIVTNNHVIDGANTITVRLANGTSYSAVPCGTDNWTDLAVLKIEVTEPLSFAAFGNSNELKVGQHVFAIGNPLGTLGGSVSDGIISALDREITVEGMPMILLQTNAAVNPGNSGGGLFNLAGQLVGVVNAKYSDESVEGLGFAIPADIAKTVVADLIAQGYVTGRPQTGVVLVTVTNSNIMDVYNNFPELYQYINGMRTYGIYVYNAKNAAVTAGTLLQGDRIISVDGTAISSFADIQTILREHKVEDEIVLKIQRLNVQGELEVTIKLTQKTITVPVS